MRVWRIHIKNDVESGYTRQDLLEFCQKEKLIGVGWGNITTRENSDSAIREQAQTYSDPTPGIKAINAMRRMQLNDLIWTRLDSKYFLCRVTDIWEHSKPREEHYKLDIPNYVNVEWLEIGMEQDVPGKVVSSFRPAASAQSVSGVEDISMYIWNKYSNTNQYAVSRKDISIWSVLSAEAIEELVLLYLQMEKGFHIYSSTVKYAFPEYECQMVNSDGIRAYPQVKSGSVSLNANDYMDALHYDPTAQIYLFSTSENYVSNGSDRIHFIFKKDIERFIRQYRKALPTLTSNWIDFCGFFE